MNAVLFPLSAFTPALFPPAAPPPPSCQNIPPPDNSINWALNSLQAKNEVEIANIMKMKKATSTQYNPEENLDLSLAPIANYIPSPTTSKYYMQDIKQQKMQNMQQK